VSGHLQASADLPPDIKKTGYLCPRAGQDTVVAKRKLVPLTESCLRVMFKITLIGCLLSVNVTELLSEPKYFCVGISVHYRTK
jgi:hypothetical protein